MHVSELTLKNVVKLLEWYVIRMIHDHLRFGSNIDCFIVVFVTAMQVGVDGIRTTRLGSFVM